MTDGINGAEIYTDKEAYKGKFKGKNGVWYPVYGGWEFRPDKKSKNKKKKKENKI